MRDLMGGAPWLLVPVAVLVGFTLAVLGDIAATFESRATVLGSHPGISLLQTTVNGLNARDRILQLFNFGSPTWALGLLLGLAVLALGEGLSALEGPHQRSTHSMLLDAYAGASALVAVGALIDVCVWLSYVAGTPALGVRSILLDLGAIGISLAVLWWALDRRVHQPGAAAGRAAPEGMGGGPAGSPPDGAAARPAGGGGGASPLSGLRERFRRDRPAGASPAFPPGAPFPPGTGAPPAGPGSAAPIFEPPAGGPAPSGPPPRPAGAAGAPAGAAPLPEPQPGGSSPWSAPAPTGEFTRPPGSPTAGPPDATTALPAGEEDDTTAFDVPPEDGYPPR
jgi:hypothetical protein